MTFEEILEIAPYSLNAKEKEKLLTERLVELTEHHRKNCPEYRRMLESICYDKGKIENYRELPFLRRCPAISIRVPACLSVHGLPSFFSSRHIFSFHNLRGYNCVD